MKWFLYSVDVIEIVAVIIASQLAVLIGLHLMFMVLDYFQ